MATNEQKPKVKKLDPIPPAEEIVISGISGRFPESDNIKLFEQNLMNKINLVTDDNRRWNLNHPDIPQFTGKINGLEKFDAEYFDIDFKQAHTMDPMARMLLEHAYEAIIDAGLNPRQLRGTKTGVFIGACFSETEKTWFYKKFQVNGFGMAGSSRAMLANRISYWLGVNGPSYTIDTACSSSLFALEHAYCAMREGLCDYALVGGANLCFHPYVSLQFSRLGVLSVDGACKSFDESANGYARSEAACVIFLQKAKHAKRIYSTVIHCKTNCDGFKDQGITFPSSAMQATLLKEFYEEIGMPPTILNYIEAHGTGTKVGDPEEINALDKIFCTGRKEPLLLGSIKSNLGHSEPVSGLCSVAKVIIGMETGLIPPNLHFKNARKGIKALEEGRLKVVTEPTPWKGGWMGINSFGFGGANAHVLLKSNNKQKVNNSQPNDDLPRLVAVSGRTEEAVATLLNDLENRPVDVEYVRLLHDIHSEDINGHLYRGYTILPPRGIAKNQIREIQSYKGEKRQVCFVFSGIGSQWPGMGKALMRLPVFADAIMNCNNVLKPHGIDIINIITNKDKNIFDNILNSFVGIAAIQIGLVDVLRSIGIEPDNVIGHSVGELGCAYVDGCFTLEEMILSAYFRGLASIESKIEPGLMATVGLCYKDLRIMCPGDIDIACHNSTDSAIISGPVESVKAFIAKLQANNIFIKEMSCSNIPYHSRYMAAAGPKLMHYLQKVIVTPRVRSGKWLSTSVPCDRWNAPGARLSSAAYHANNLLSPVLFEETSKLISSNAIVIEIAPHDLLQDILKRSLPPTATNISLMKKGHRDTFEAIIQELGKMYNIGLQPKLHKLYPYVAYPVSCRTPMISPLIKWEHSENWYVSSYKDQEKILSGENIINVSLKDEDFEFVSGHVIDGRILFPATGYLALVWETLGLMCGKLYTEVSVIFENVKFLRATTMTKDTRSFKIMIQKGTGNFEVVESGATVVTGSVHVLEDPATERINLDLFPANDEKETMTSRDIYQELKLRGYQYNGLFRGLKSASITGSNGHITWNGNWVSFMDNMLQMQIIVGDTRGLFVPTGITKMIIDTKDHVSQLRSMPEDNKEFPVIFNKDLSILISGGVEIHGLKASAISRRKPAGDPVLELYKFIPRMDRAEFTLEEVVRLCMHTAIENHLSMKIKTLEFLEKSDKITIENLLSPLIVNALTNLPLIQADVNIINNDITLKEDEALSKISLMDSKKVTDETSALVGVGHKLLTPERAINLKLLLTGIQEGGFVITREDAVSTKSLKEIAQNKRLEIILEKISGNELFVLLRKCKKLPKNNLILNINNNDFNWVEKMTKIMKEELEKRNDTSTRIIFVGEGDFDNGLIGFINCLRRELGGEMVRGVLIQDPKAPKFSLQHPLYAKELQKDLAVSVLRENCVWGSYRHLPLPPQKPKLVPHAWANQLVRADLSSLNWLEGPIQADFKHDNLVKIIYSSINFRDIMLASGKLAVELVAKTRQAQECVLGFEFCGITSKGKRIMGMLEHKAMANLCMADPDLSWDIPDSWSFEDAATVPCVYGTCIYALYVRGKMKKNDKVLIHAGSGGVGQAAITLALHEGCEVFTTVGTPDKRKFIMEHFPQIPENHIGNSRNTSFKLMIMQQTNGRGVDIVLNSLAEEKLQSSVRCLAPGGRFLEIGKFDLASNNPLSIECFSREISFHGIMLDSLFQADSNKKRILRDRMSVALRDGSIKPLTRTVFNKDQLEEAFRFMGAGKHIGKVIIKIHDENEVQDELIMALPRFHCLDNHSYLILGGLGGFGLELVDWLILRGAKNVVITSRVGVKTGYQEMRISLWKSYGTKVVVISGKDAAKRDECQEIIQAAEKLAPIDAIFNLAVSLRDALWENQTPETYEETFRAKAWATKHLDVLTRKLCPQLRKFICFSSVSCGRGNAGQTNYGMSNSVMERICERRVAEGFPGLAVQWGAVGDVGLVANMQEDNKEVVIGGTLLQGITSCLRELDGFLRQDVAIVSSMVVSEKRAGSNDSMNVVDTVLNIIGLKDLKTISLQTPLSELGMDSMMAVEIKQTLEREFDIALSPQDIHTLNFAKLQEMSLKDTKEDNGDKNTNADKMATGIKLLVRTVGLDVINDEVCLNLDTKWETDRRAIFMLPGIEGMGTVYNNIASKINAPAYCLQLGIKYNIMNDTEKMAEKLLPYVLEKNKDHRDFYIVGYSYGSLIAIELVRKLEAQGMNGKLLLIDGSPDLMVQLKIQKIAVDNENELESNILQNMMDIVSPTTSQQLVGEMDKLNSWDEKLKCFLSLLPPTLSKMHLEYQADFCTTIYNRIKSIEKYYSTSLPPIKAAITLLKPTIPTLQSLAEDYGLSKLTRDKVEIFYVEGNHITILDNSKVATVINGEPMEEADIFKAGLCVKNGNSE